MKAKFANDNVRKEFKSTLIIALVAVLLFGGIGIIRAIVNHGSSSNNTTIIVPDVNDDPVSDNGNEEPDQNYPLEDPDIPNYDGPYYDDEDNENPTVTVVEEKLVKPFKVSAKTVRYFFDLEDNLDKQQKAVYYFEGVYKPSVGMSFSYNDEKFDVTAAFEGTVKELASDSLLGYVVKIENENGLVATYASLSEVNVKEGDIVKQDDIIGKAGTCSLESDLGNHVYFALNNAEGKNLNPEKYFDKEIKDM